MIDPEAGSEQRLLQQPTTTAVAFPLNLDVILVTQGSDHRGLNRGGHHHAGMLAHLQQFGDQTGIAGQVTGPVAGHVRPLR